jgi:8-oxo-dGTP pyrophosphatase MutT (NUDIX family)
MDQITQHKSANGLPFDLDGWELLVRRAIALDHQIPREDLLFVRLPDGQVARSLIPPPGVTPRIGAVMIALYPDGSDLRVILTVRSQELVNHRGEVSLPGGGIDPSDPDLISTALRECQEELGLDPTSIQIVGSMAPIYITPSNFEITPVIGHMSAIPVLQPNDAEVEQVISATLRDLLDPMTVIVEPWVLRGHDVMVPYFAIAGHKVWGATALILSELVARMRYVLIQPMSS